MSNKPTQNKTKQQTLQAFHNDHSIKQKYLDRIIAHEKADEIIKGTYWEGGKGCAVGCTLHSSDHARYESELGIPSWLGYVQDRLFEGMPRHKTFPRRFIQSIPVGFSDWTTLYHDYCIFLLRDICPPARNPKLRALITHIIHLHETRETNPKVWDDAAADAYATAYATAALASSSSAAALAYATAAKNARKQAYAKIADHLLEMFEART